MSKEELKIGEISKPRFEFRSFGRCFCPQEKRMAHFFRYRKKCGNVIAYE